jgi:hypothetical protein
MSKVILLTASGLATLCSLTLTDLANAGVCSQRAGPFETQNAAISAQQQARYSGYGTSGIWGEGGIISDWSNRRYYFNIFFPC